MWWDLIYCHWNLSISQRQPIYLVHGSLLGWLSFHVCHRGKIGSFVYLLVQLLLNGSNQYAISIQWGIFLTIDAPAVAYGDVLSSWFLEDGLSKRKSMWSQCLCFGISHPWHQLSCSWLKLAWVWALLIPSMFDPLCSAVEVWSHLPPVSRSDNAKKRSASCWNQCFRLSWWPTSYYSIINRHESIGNCHK